MSEKIEDSCGRNVFIYIIVAFLALVSAFESLNAYLYFPAAVWIIAGTLVAGIWSHEKLCRFEKMRNGEPDCGTCGLFGHRLPWILLVASGLLNLFELSNNVRLVTAYADAVAIFSLAGSFVMMRLSEGDQSGE